ncbi:MAG: diacylglycerol/lipid kinase family protein [Chitinophagales bacterium]
MKKTVLFIINPISGDIKKANLPNVINKHLDKNMYEHTIKYSEHAGHATHLAKEAVEKQFDIVVAVGGDGSINEISQALLNTNTALAIIPMGSGNGLASHLKLPIRKPKAAIEVINNSKIEKIDVGTSNYGSFVSCAGIGLEAMAARVYRHQSIRGFFSYLLAIHKSVLFQYRSKNHKIKFQIDEQWREENVYMFTVFNSQYFGYEQGFAPLASLTDGYFDLVLVKGLPAWKIPFLIILGLLKKVHLLKESEFHKVKKIEIEAKKKRIAQLDGDSFIASDKFTIEIKEKALAVLVSKKMKNI